MAEYIDREKAELGVQGLTIVDPTVAAYAEAVLFILRDAPAADVAPVIHGRWNDGICSECGFDAMYYKGESVQVYTRYCPTCGALMDGKEDKDEAN